MSMVSNFYIAKFFTKIINIITNRKLEVAYVKNIKNISSDYYLVEPERETYIYLPDYRENGPDRVITITAPEIRVFKIKNVEVSGSSASLLKDNILYIETFVNKNDNNLSYDSTGILKHSGEISIINKGRNHFIEKGMFLCGNGSWNYYHWLIEILPKIKIYLELMLYEKGVPLIIPEKIKSDSNMKSLLDYLLNGYDCNYIYIDSKFSTTIGELYYSTAVNDHIFNERELTNTLKSQYFRYDWIDFLSNKIMEAIDVEGGGERK